MIPLAILNTILSLFSNAYSTVEALIAQYGYSAIFLLMLLEGSSLPVPSEVVLPLTGFFAANGTIDIYIGFLAALLGSIAGLAVDYYIGYFIGKDVVYKHLRFFHIKKETLDAFDAWFDRNGIASVFFIRFVPVLRTVISFPAGFAEMPAKEFFGYSIAGCFIFDVVLVAFGYYALSSSSAVTVLASIGVFAIALYIVYRYALKYIKSK